MQLVKSQFMSNKVQVIVCGFLLGLISVWAYYFQFEAAHFMADYDYEASLIWQQPWRLVTAHFLHLTTLHWLGNVLALVGLTLVFARHFSVRTFLNALLILTVGTSVILWLSGFDDRFVGLSAVNHGLLAMGILLEYKDATSPSQQRLMLVAGTILLLKLAAEWIGLWHSPIAAAGQMHDLWQLHGAGIISGILAWWLHNRHLARLAQLDTD